MFIVAVLWLGFFVINFNVVMMVSLLPFIGRDVPLSPVGAGLVLAAFPVVALFSNLVLGRLTDRFGRKRFIVLGAAACGTLLLLTAAGGSVAAIVLGRAATGLFMPMIGASVFAAVSDYFPPGGRARVIGYVTTAAPIAFLVSISMGMLVGGLLTWRLPLAILAAICLALAAAASILPAVVPAGPSAGQISAKPRRLGPRPAMDFAVMRLLVAYFCWSLAMYVFLGLYPSWLVERGLAASDPGTIGTVLFLGEIGGLFGALLSARLVAVFHRHFLVAAVASLSLSAVVVAAPFGAGSAAAEAVVYALFAFGRDLMLALMLGGAMWLVPASRRGRLNGTLNAIYQSGATAGGLAGAWLYGTRGDFFSNAAASCAGFIACAVVLVGIAGRSIAAHARNGDLLS